MKKKCNTSCSFFNFLWGGDYSGYNAAGIKTDLLIENLSRIQGNKFFVYNACIL